MPMLGFLASLLLGATTFVSAIPAALERRNVTALDPVAWAQAQQRDNTATRAFSNIEIQVCRSSSKGFLSLINRELCCYPDWRRTMSLCEPSIRGRSSEPQSCGGREL